MIRSARPLLFLDIDGPLIPFGATPHQLPSGYPTYRTSTQNRAAESNPLLSRINPDLGPRLSALPCDLVWATTWMDTANEEISPRLGLPQLPVVLWPEPTDRQAEQDQRNGLHWKTRPLIDWAAGHPFAWVDDEITNSDRAWVSEHHPGQALLHRVDHRYGLVEADFVALHDWLSRVDQRPQ